MNKLSISSTTIFKFSIILAILSCSIIGVYYLQKSRNLDRYYFEEVYNAWLQGEGMDDISTRCREIQAWMMQDGYNRAQINDIMNKAFMQSSKMNCAMDKLRKEYSK